MKKKILGIVLSLTMVGAMLAGCGQQQGAEDKKEETKKKKPRQKIPIRTKRTMRTSRMTKQMKARRKAPASLHLLPKKT
ncbi:MAG: hypothetical protein ACLRMZ_00745 [Blautia marasmi]